MDGWTDGHFPTEQPPVVQFYVEPLKGSPKPQTEKHFRILDFFFSFFFTLEVLRRTLRGSSLLESAPN